MLDAFGGRGGFLGPVAYHLGVLAATLGRQAEAEARVEAAVEVAACFGATPWVVQGPSGAGAAPRASWRLGASGESR